MKKLLTIFMCLLVLFGLIGCKTKKMVTESVTSERTDTTKVTTDSIHKVTTKSENRTTLTLYNDWGHIEFADSGGTLTIDTKGSIIAKGVKAYFQGKQATKKKTENTAQRADSTVKHQVQNNGVQSRDNKQAKQEPQKQGVKALKWYERAIYHIGILSVLAAIFIGTLWYLKHKK